MARPTEFIQAIVSKARHYLDSTEEYGNVIPSIVGLAQFLGLSRLNRQKDAHPEKLEGVRVTQYGGILISRSEPLTVKISPGYLVVYWP